MNKKSEEKNLGSGQVPGKTQLFPLEVFPPFLQSYVTNLHRDFGTSIDHLAAGLLFAASAAIGRTHLLEWQPGYGFSGQLFLAIVGDPATNKRAALDFPLETIFDRDHQAFLNYERQLRESTGTRRKGAKRYHRPAILMTDNQAEVVASVHQDNLRGIALHQFYLDNWVRNLARKKEKAFWSAVWSGYPIELKWKARQIYIEEPYISVAGILRTSMMKELVRSKYISDRLAERLLFVYPDQQEKPDWTLYEVPEEQENEFRNGINKLMDLTMDEADQPQLIRLDKAARGVLCDFLNQEDSSGEQANQPVLCATYTMRFCLLLQLLWWMFDGIEKDVVQPEMVIKAIQLKEYFESHSRKVLFKPIEPSWSRLTLRKRQVYTALPDRFKLMNGLAIADKLGIKKRTFQRFVNNNALFTKLGHGYYQKLKQEE